MEKQWSEKLAYMWNSSYNDVQKTFANFLEEVKKTKKDVIPDNDKYFKNIVEQFIKANIQAKDNTTKTLLKNFWFKNKDIQNITADKLFANHKFRVFLSWLIRNPNLLKQKLAIINVSSQATVGADILTSKIEDIK